MRETAVSSSRPLLTFAVPTWNRANYLATLLSALAPQLVGEKRVELLISDNATQDETQTVVRRFLDEGLPIRYIRNETNIGPDRNFLQCFDLAAGKYVWIFGDDDVLEPGGLKRVLDHLSGDEEYDLVFIRPSGFTGAYTAKDPGSRKGFTVFDRPQDLACEVHVFFTFISGNIVNKDRISAFPHRDFGELAGTNLVQLSWVYTALEHHRRSLVIHDPLVAALTNNIGGYGLYTVFGPTLKRITEEWLTSDSVRRPILRGTLQAFLPSFILSDLTQAVTSAHEDPDKTLRPAFGQYFQYWLFNFPLMRLPRSLARVWLLGTRAVNKADKIVGNPLLRL
jgi:abequosyltransferase